VSVCVERNCSFSFKNRKSNRMAESNSNGFVQPTIPKFDGHYDHWMMLMENFLHSKEYWDLIKNGISVVVTKGHHKLIKD